MRKKLKNLSFVLAALAIAWGGYTWYRFAGNHEARTAACFSQGAAILQSGTEPDYLFRGQFADLQSLVEQSLVARAEMLAVASQLAGATQQSRPDHTESRYRKLPRHARGALRHRQCVRVCR